MLTSSQEHAQGAVLELVQRVVVALVDRPELVRVTRISGERAVVIEVAAVPPEVGQIIGRGGRNIHALQAITAGSRDRSLADAPDLSPTMAAEVLLLIETLEKAGNQRLE